jgi:hypothetical protein
MRTTFLTLATLAALAVSTNPAEAQRRGRFVIRNAPYYSNYYTPYRSYATPYYGGYYRPYSSYSYATPYYGNYVTPASGFSFSVGNGYNFYPGRGYSSYPGYRYWW